MQGHFMKNIETPFLLGVLGLLLTGCAGLTPDFYKTIDDVATNNTLEIYLDKEAFEKKDCDIEIHVSIKKNDGKQAE